MSTSLETLEAKVSELHSRIRILTEFSGDYLQYWKQPSRGEVFRVFKLLIVDILYTKYHDLLDVRIMYKEPVIDHMRDLANMLDPIRYDQTLYSGKQFFTEHLDELYRYAVSDFQKQWPSPKYPSEQQYWTAVMNIVPETCPWKLNELARYNALSDTDEVIAKLCEKLPSI